MSPYCDRALDWRLRLTIQSLTLKRILIVDDEPFICTTVSMLLRLESYSVASACDGRAGLLYALENPPDVILSDVNMPHMGGYQLLAAVRSHPTLGGTRMVLLNAQVDTALATQAGGGLPDACLGKPFTREQLLKVLGQVVP